MKKKTKAKIASSVNDIIFSEIDLKETTFNNKDVKYYSLDIMSDNSSNSPRNSDNSSNNSPHSGSFNLDDYDLNIDDLSDDLNDNLNIKNISIKNSSDSLNNIQEDETLNVSKINNPNDIDDIHNLDDIDNIHNLDDINDLDNDPNNINDIINNNNIEDNQDDITYKKCEETKTKLNTSEFFKILNQNQTQNITTIQEDELNDIEITKNQNDEIPNNNENQEEQQIDKEDIVQTDRELENILNNNNQEQNGEEDNQEQNGEEDNQEEEENKKSVEDLHNMNTQEKVNIWKDLIDTNINAHSSYNYLQTETQNNNLLNLINKDRLFKFYKLAEKNKKNIYGYIDNNKIYNCEPHTTYDFEVHTKLTNENIDPPGNYINIFMKKDLDKIKCVYLLNSNGYWTMEPLENFQSFKDDETKQKILLIYFIILKILFCNKHYPFNDGNSIQKYRNLTKNINLNIINHINTNINFKKYINNQFKSVFKLTDTIEDILNIIDKNKINKYYGRILKLKYKYY